MSQRPVEFIFTEAAAAAFPRVSPPFVAVLPPLHVASQSTACLLPACRNGGDVIMPLIHHGYMRGEGAAKAGVALSIAPQVRIESPSETSRGKSWQALLGHQPTSMLLCLPSHCCCCLSRFCLVLGHARRPALLAAAGG
eukprot:SAG22_NODE_10293_length_543_cov_0.770270_1_plen_139_part_00